MSIVWPPLMRAMSTAGSWRATATMRGVLPFCGHHPTTTTRERCWHQQWTPTHTPHLAGCVDVDAWARKQVVHDGYGARAHCRSQRRVSNLGTHTGVHRGSLGKCIAHRLSPHASGRHELIRRPASQDATCAPTHLHVSLHGGLDQRFGQAALRGSRSRIRVRRTGCCLRSTCDGRHNHP